MGPETRESSTGVKLLSAYPRALQGYYEHAHPIVAGVQNILIPFRCAGVAVGPAGNNYFPLRANRRFRFGGSAVLYLAASGISHVAIESAGLTLVLGTDASPLTGHQLLSAARFGSLTALASGNQISFDQWEVDCNDLLQMTFPQGPPGANPGPYQNFALYETIVINDTGGATNADIFASLEISAADFNSTHFDKWE
jgi:hypothetical protein